MASITEKMRDIEEREELAKKWIADNPDDPRVEDARAHLQVLRYEQIVLLYDRR